MPYKIQYTKLKLPKELDRRIKLTDQQRDEIRINIDWLSQRKLALKYWVSRRLVSFILNPDEYERSKEAFKKRRKDWRYYNKDKHTIAIKEHRQYKQSIWYERLKTLQEEEDLSL